MEPLTLDISALGRSLSDAELLRLCETNPQLRIERDAHGQLLLMSPTSPRTGRRNVRLLLALGNWSDETELGESFDSSTGFTLPNGALRSPDASWIRMDRWEAVPEADKERFARICPDFVAELRSKTDRLPALQAKMREWMDNGCRLGWLIDPENEQAFIYRTDGSVTTVDTFDTNLDGEDVLPGFSLPLARLR